mmetsp:Transcript_90791/g.256408  ORF Transcript_90791/g.256408 Transcript_90791/m.256408 type:complete len:98 (-) Transcript_90791:32-325(-)
MEEWILEVWVVWEECLVWEVWEEWVVWIFPKWQKWLEWEECLAWEEKMTKLLMAEKKTVMMMRVYRIWKAQRILKKPLYATVWSRNIFFAHFSRVAC